MLGIFMAQDLERPLRSIIGMVGALTRFPIIDPLGLTNPIVARKVVTKRSRPGHEKSASVEELLASGAVWSLDPYYGALAEGTRMKAQGLDAWVLRDTKALRAVLPQVPEPSHVLSVVKTPEDARALAWAVGELYVERPEVRREFEARWGLASGAKLTRTGEVLHAEGACEDGARRALGSGTRRPLVGG